MAQKVALKEVKILMLHGYTQSGPLFRGKVRALEKLLVKFLAPLSLTPALIFPTAPIRLRPEDVPGFEVTPSSTDSSSVSTPGGETADAEIDSFAWFRRNVATGQNRFLDQGMRTVAAAIREAGGVDGVVGFSQGASMAAMVTATLEGPEYRPVPEGSEEAVWAGEVREANQGRPLRFAVMYSGFVEPSQDLAWCYKPPLVTPTMHYIGSLDTVVAEERSQALVEKCKNPVTAIHPGGHHVPISKEWAMRVIGFIREHCQGTTK